MAVSRSDEKRRAGGAIRVPFVRRCQIDYTGGQTDSAFIVNINVLGAYVANEVMPTLGRTLVFRFLVPGSEREVVTDGVVAWQCSVEKEGPLTENIEVEASHLGMGLNPMTFYAIADRLAQPEGEWKPFDRGGLRSLLYRNPRRRGWF